MILQSRPFSKFQANDTQWGKSLGGFNSRLNGIGSIRSVINGTALAPMQYRIVIPFLTSWVRDYNFVKLSMMFLSGVMLWLVSYALYGNMEAWIVLFVYQIFDVFSWQFDYTEQYLEMLSWAIVILAALHGNVCVACGMSLIAALNRETSIYLPFVYWGVTGSIVGGLICLGGVVVALVFLRLKYGIRPNYLDIYGFGGIKNKNHLIVNIKSLSKFSGYTLTSGVLIILSIISLWYGILDIRFNVIAVLMVLIWLFRSRIDESRVGLPLIFFAVQPLIRWFA